MVVEATPSALDSVVGDGLRSPLRLDWLGLRFGDLGAMIARRRAVLLHPGICMATSAVSPEGAILLAVMYVPAEIILPASCARFAAVGVHPRLISLTFPL